MRGHGKRGRSAVREAAVCFIGIVVLCAVLFLLVNYVGERTEVRGNAMYPTLNNGDQLVIDILTYKFSDPKRFDLIAFPFQYQEDTVYVRRVIGLPGETVQITDGVIYINGSVLEESYGYELISNPGLAAAEVTLSEQEYFVLGDNRSDSTDSREPSVGNVTKDQIIGKAVLRIWPVSSLGFIE